MNKPSYQGLNARQIQDWVRWYKIASPDYKAHALSAILKADGVKTLGAVLKALKLESSVDLVRNWNESTAETSPRKNDGMLAGKDAFDDDTQG